MDQQRIERWLTIAKWLAVVAIAALLALSAGNATDWDNCNATSSGCS